ncbi:MAG TPA: FGGY family carbohydrate kinase [Terriglobales bacterium]|nr:FGGY family carbohydrate kinase [Terriglobales bacterium]
MPAGSRAGSRSLIGVDVGSTHIKAALVTPESGVIHVALRATETHAVRGGGAFHRPSEMLASVSSAIAECVATAASSIGQKPVAIGIASMAESGVPIDRRRAPVGDILAWHDPRPERQAAWLERQIGAAQLFARTGLRPEPKCTLAKLLWLREHKAADFTRLRRWAGVAELVGLDLTGQLGTNASLACRTLAFDVTLRAWDAELLALASLTTDEMPTVLPLGQAVGGLTAAAAVRLGLPAGTPVVVAGHDHLAGAIGAGVTKVGDALNSMGSAEATMLVTAAPALTEEVRRGGFSTGCHAVDGLAYVSGGLQSSGALVEWFIETFLPTGAGEGCPRGVAGEAPGGNPDRDRYARFAALLEQAGSGPAEPIVLPYLRGRTAPHRDPSATLEIEGLRETHGMVDLAAAVVDGAAFHVRWMIDELARITETRLDRVKLTGGGARNRRWVTAKAALGPGRLEVVRTEEAAALGAALVAGVAGGVYASVADALADASPFDRAVVPATIRARYDAAYLDRWLPTVVTRLRQSGI